MPKNFVEEPFCAVFQKLCGTENVYGQEEGGVSRYFVEYFRLAVPKKIPEEPFCAVLQINSGSETVYG